MEFQILLSAQDPDMGRIRQALFDADHSVIVDREPRHDRLRVSTLLDGFSLLMALRASGWLLAPSRISHVPSTCCGGCGG